MLAPRWHKVFADLWSNKARTILAVLSIAVGVLTVGNISTSYAIVGRTMDASFRAIHPAGGYLFGSLFSQDFVTALNRVAGVGRAEGRTYMTGCKVQLAGSQQRDLTLWALPDYNDVQLDQLILQGGRWPARREVLLEANSRAKLPAAIGDTVQVLLPDGKLRELKVAGFVSDRNSDATSTGVRAYLCCLSQPSSESSSVPVTSRSWASSWRC